MSVKPCQFCGHEFASKANRCPSCDAERPTPVQPRVFGIGFISLGIIFAACLGFILFVAMENTGLFKSVKADSKRSTAVLQIQGSGWYGGTTKEVTAQIKAASQENDDKALSSLVSAGKMTGHITEFQDGETVLLESSTMFGGQLKVRRRGANVAYWVPREATQKQKSD